MKRAGALAALFALGLTLALAVARPAHAGIDCSTDPAAEVAAATVTDLGNAWSQPGQGDLWDVSMTDIALGVSVYAQDDAGARAAAETYLEQQIAALTCTPTTTAPTTTAAPQTATVTVASPPDTVTQTVTETVTLPAQTVVRTVTQTVTSTTVETVTVQAPAPPVNVSVNVGAKAPAKKKPAHEPVRPKKKAPRKRGRR